MMTVDDQIRAVARQLKLPAIAAYRQYLVNDPPESFSDTLLQLLQAELDGRQQRSFARRLKQAQFPFGRTLDTFIPDRLPHLSSEQIQWLATCNYIRERHNVVAIGNSGTGKSHLSEALGIEAARQGSTVRFHMVMPLLNQLIEAPRTL